jgi:hypothetical protein
METMYEIWDEHGTCLEVGHDRDGLGLIEIRERDSNNEITRRMEFDVEQAKLVIQALTQTIRDSHDSSFEI